MTVAEQPLRLETNLLCRLLSVQTELHSLTHTQTHRHTNKDHSRQAQTHFAKLSSSLFSSLLIYFRFLFSTSTFLWDPQPLALWPTFHPWYQLFNLTNKIYVDIKVVDMYDCTPGQSCLKNWLDRATLKSEGCRSNLKPTADPIMKQWSLCTQEMI